MPAHLISCSESQSAGLGEPENILKIHGLAIAPGEIDAQAETWDGVKSNLYAVAQEVVAADSKDAMVSKKAKFIGVLEEFCADYCDEPRIYFKGPHPPRQVTLRRLV